MSDSEFQRHLGGTHWRISLVGPTLLLFFSLLALFISAIRAASLTAIWSDYLIFGLATLGTAACIAWLVKIGK
jgi:hypothetical protein